LIELIRQLLQDPLDQVLHQYHPSLLLVAGEEKEKQSEQKEYLEKQNAEIKQID
jgi:hypothetical protein